MTRKNRRNIPPTNGGKNAALISNSPIPSASNEQPIHRKILNQVLSYVLSLPNELQVPYLWLLVLIIVALVGSFLPKTVGKVSLLMNSEWNSKKWESTASQDTLYQSFDGSIQLDSSQLPAKTFELKTDLIRTVLSAPPDCLAGDLLAGTHNVVAYHFLMSFNPDGSLKLTIFCKGMKTCHVVITFKCVT
jgi:hypothetical protein